MKLESEDCPEGTEERTDKGCNIHSRWSCICVTHSSCVDGSMASSGEEASLQENFAFSTADECVAMLQAIQGEQRYNTQRSLEVEITFLLLSRSDRVR